MIGAILKLIAAGALVLLAGCYTRFASVDWQSISPDTRTSRDSTRSTIPDTLALADDETCVWERDLMGFPYLRCYRGYYPREWYRNNFTPWWYQTNAPYHDGSRCPEYYYYDKTCGCCRYYLNNPELVRTARGISRTKETRSSVPPSQTPADTVNRVNVTATTHTSATIPLRDGRLQGSSPKYQVTARDSSAQKGAQLVDSTRGTTSAVIDSARTDSTKQTDRISSHPAVEVAPQVNKPRRTTRER